MKTQMQEVAIPEMKIVDTPDILDLTKETAGDVSRIFGEVISGVTLNIREKPALTSRILSVIESGEKLEILHDDENSEFYRICTSFGLEGYCMKMYVKLF